MSSRTLLLVLGVATLAAVWIFRLHEHLPGPFSAHMTMHMAVVAVAAPLIAASIAGTTRDPVRRAPWLFAPLIASGLELVAVWGWHAPALHHFARNTGLGLLLEQSMFFATALFVWIASIGGDAARGGDRAGSGVLALLITSMHMTLLGALLAMPTRVLYEHHAHGALSPIADQHLGGAIMLVAGGASYLAGALFLSTALLKRRAGALA